MSFLSNLFGHGNKEALNSAELEEQDEDLDELEDLYSADDDDDLDFPPGITNVFDGMSLDVFTKEGHLLLSGRITGHSPTSLTLERLPGFLAFDTLPEDTEVSARGYNSRMVQFNLSARIQESTRIVCRLKDIEATTIENRRLNFRIRTNMPAWLYNKNDEKYLRSENCKLVDVSTGGCCVESEHVHEENEILRIKIKLEDYQSMQFLGQVVRSTDLGGGQYQYGILFAQLREDEQMSLTRALYNIQMGNRRRGSSR